MTGVWSLQGTGEIGPEAGAQWPLTRNSRNTRVVSGSRSIAEYHVSSDCRSTDTTVIHPSYREKD